MNMNMPHYVVIFTSKHSSLTSGYEEMTTMLENRLKTQRGFLGMDTARSEVGITICYWDSLEAIEKWKSDPIHQKAQKMGQKQWYESYTVRVCKVEKAYTFFAKDTF